MPLFFFLHKKTLQYRHLNSKIVVKFYRNSIIKPLELLAKLNLNAEQISYSNQANNEFAFKVPQSFIDKIRPNDVNDPLLRQIFPIEEETQSPSNYSFDPLNEADSCLQPGLLQKYHGRALLLVTPSCAIHCRYCFRRHYPYTDKGHAWQQIIKNIELIKKNSTINEIILSGGDPLSLSNERLQKLIHLIETIPHIKRIRIHSRTPIVEPSRIDQKLLNILSKTVLTVIMVLHINHPNEIGLDNQEKIAKLHKKGIILFNQSVLLKGVNDHLETLIELSEKLVHNHIIPYYLHVLDPVRGSSHFYMNDQKIKKLYQNLRSHLSGYMLPRLVKEIAGKASKTPFYL